MTKSIERKIREVRPKLRRIRPLPYWIIVIYALFNLILGFSLFIAFDQQRLSASLLIVNEVLTYRVWGVVFMGLGILKLFSLFTNNWELSRRTLLVGVVIKAAWAIALTVRSFVSPGTLILNLMWVSLALIQVVTFIFFVPPVHKEQKNDK